LAALLSGAAACTGAPRPAIDERVLMTQIGRFEVALQGTSDAQKLVTLHRFANQMLHQRVRVTQARVAAVYTRGSDWNTQPFFGFDYAEEHYVRLLDLDPEFDRRLKACRHWASVACTLGDRQLMFELALDSDADANLRPGQQVSFTCEVASIIRGKTVYSRLVTMAR
jgi:hypothetical protein